jgi:vitamin K-dependent gamma-carboxylase
VSAGSESAVRRSSGGMTGLFRRVDIGSLVAFRIAFGAVVLWEVSRYLERGWVLSFYVDPIYNFPFEGFEWVKPLGATGMVAVFALLAMAAFLVMAGLVYRTAAALTFLGLAYVFLLEQSVYLNHFYLVVLIGFLMILVPAHHAAALDVSLRRVPHRDWAPAWAVYLLRFQLGVVYFYGAVAKLNYDWMVAGEPLRHWLRDSTWFPLVGPLLDEPWAPYVVGWSGFAIDLLTPFLLLQRRTRPFMLAALLAFHFINDRLFSIGIFPWFAIAATTIFLPPDWPKRLATTARTHRTAVAVGASVSLALGLFMHRGFELVPALVAILGGALLVWAWVEAYGPAIPAEQRESELVTMPGPRNALVGFLVVWAVVQILLPVRHLVIPGDVAWTEEGHRFAWRMKLRSKEGYAKFYAYDPATRMGTEVRADTLLTEDQFQEMAGRPHMIYQFARYLRERLAAQGKPGMEIRVAAFARVNYGRPGLMIDPRVDLAAQTYSDFRHNWWIRPRPSWLPAGR